MPHRLSHLNCEAWNLKDSASSSYGDSYICDSSIKYSVKGKTRPTWSLKIICFVSQPQSGGGAVWPCQTLRHNVLWGLNFTISTVGRPYSWLAKSTTEEAWPVGGAKARLTVWEGNVKAGSSCTLIYLFILFSVISLFLRLILLFFYPWVCVIFVRFI